MIKRNNIFILCIIPVVLLLSVIMILKLFPAKRNSSNQAQYISEVPRISKNSSKHKPAKRSKSLPRTGIAGKRIKTVQNYRLTEKQKRAIMQLQAIGYIDGEYNAPSKKNVTLYDEDRTYNSLNLAVSMHAPEAVLIDMKGYVLHKWRCDVFKAWPDFNPKGWKGKKASAYNWRRAHLLDNGDLLAIFEGIGLIKLDKHSNVLWSTMNGAHHDLYVARNGDIFVLAREAHINPKYNPEEPVLEDYICVLDPQGNELSRVPVLEVLENSVYAPVLRRMEPHGDILHSNAIGYIEEEPSGPRNPLKKNTVLISIRELNFVCAVDLSAKSVYWGESDVWHHQHECDMLSNGNLLIFDNRGLVRQSSVLEYNPATGTVDWFYKGGKEDPFYSSLIGACQRLPNGNTLVIESMPGRAFEVTRDKHIVWEYINPHRAGRDPNLIAVLLDVIRLDKNFPVDWLPE